MSPEIPYSKHLFYQNIKKRRPRLSPRELGVLGIAAIILMIMPWAWGGVVWWATMATLGLSAGILLLAIGNFRIQVIFTSLWAILLTTIIVLAMRGVIVGTEEILNYVLFPSTALLAQCLGAALFYDDVKSKSAGESFKSLIKLPPFWFGLALFSYFAIQGLNNWGTVVERDLFWKVFKEPFLHWLPSGLKAPFISEENDPGGMNAWRLLLTFLGPWMFFCALSVGLLRRRAFITLAWISVGMAVILAAYGYTHQISEGYILGYPIPSNARTFGPFINRTHACTYFYFNSAIALALTFWHFRRKQNSDLLGGPHLISLFAAALLFFGVFLTFSIGGIIISAALFLFFVPLAYFMGMPTTQKRNLGSNVVTTILILFLLGGLAYTYKYDQLEYRVRQKFKQAVGTIGDERVALRHATTEMIMADKAQGRFLYGWGAGSYRWISPYFQAKQKTLQDDKGHLKIRATYAHCDWLQMISEWGFVGMIPVFLGLFWVLKKGLRSFVRGAPEAIPLFGALVLFSIHLSIDLLIWFTPLLFILAFTIAMLNNLLAHDLRGFSEEMN